MQKNNEKLDAVPFSGFGGQVNLKAAVAPKNTKKAPIVDEDADATVHEDSPPAGDDTDAGDDADGQ